MRSDFAGGRMTVDPLRTARSGADLGETSLALPSDHDGRSAQQRVLEQVSTIKRTKSKYSSSSRTAAGGGTAAISPTSSQSDSVFYDYKYIPSMTNGSAFMSEVSMANGHSKSGKQSQSYMHRTTSTRTTSSQRNLSNSMLPSSPQAVSSQRGRQECFTKSHSLELASPPPVNTVNTRWSQTCRQASRVERKHSNPLNSSSQIIGNGTIFKTSNGNQFTSSQIIRGRPPSTHSNPEIKASAAVRSKSESNMKNGETRSTDLTLPEAVCYLQNQDEFHQQLGASFIQHSTFTDDKAKQEVLTLKGIPPLVSLMSSPNPEIQKTAASALRNLVFKDQANKEEVQRCEGIIQAVQLLQETDCAETKKHVTGLLWNLSSANNLKSELLRSALPAISQTVLKPAVATSNSSVDPEIFYNATGCLRNLSSGKVANRKAMRSSEGLVESLVTYVKGCVDEENQDDKSVENSVCILHNLTYQLESECPEMFSKMNTLAGTANYPSSTTDTGPIGCFSSQSRKAQQESRFDYPVIEDNNPKGQNWLIHSQTLQSYLSLLGSSTKEGTQEACCGALHNLTANKSIVSDVLSQTIVQKLNGLKYITPLLESSNPSLTGSITSLLGNLSRNPRLQSAIARQALPQLVQTVCTGVTNGADLSPETDSTIATACYTVNNLLKVEPEMSKKMLNNTFINSLNDISKNTALPKANTAAGVLLQSLWADKNLQSFLKKQGMNKKSFVNDKTLAALRSVQVVE
ncbi:plakophilin-1 [Hoplias malabaricus]|uniref:plakophilin-1 n=1 Tax=Hoplias malabaricus TaxID=27720 RepID=UPI00346287DC